MQGQLFPVAPSFKGQGVQCFRHAPPSGVPGINSVVRRVYFAITAKVVPTGKCS